MNTITVQSKKEYTEETKILIPYFRKQDYSILGKGEVQYFAILDEKTAISLVASNDEINILNTSPEKCEWKIASVNSTWDLCSEEEFLSAYDDAREALRLNPVLVDTGIEERLNDLKNNINY